MFTMSSSNTPRLHSVSTGVGVPNKISDNSVPSIEPPQPSDKAVLNPILTRDSASAVHPI